MKKLLRRFGVLLAKIRGLISFADLLVLIGLIFLFMGSWRLDPTWAYLLVGSLIFILGIMGSIFGGKNSGR